MIPYTTAIILVVWGGLLLAFRRPLLALWREPVLKVPILVFESDDWGPGPAEQTDGLSAVGKLLGGFRDRHGRCPVMALGVVLAVPERDGSDGDVLNEATLQDRRFKPFMDVIERGVASGVFYIQLHGRSHYWPAALSEAAKTDPSVASWLTSGKTWQTESLPAGLQSRWAPEIQGETFPIPAEAARTAAEQEARLFQACFGISAAIAVPTTFVWNTAVEKGWAAAGIRAVVTPGRYYQHRGQFDQAEAGSLITNGMHANGIDYVVRDRYFEPYKGHDANDGLHALETNTALGRPTLLETHRVNFVDQELRNRALAAMRMLLERALVVYPELRFLSTAQLVECMSARSAGLIVQALRPRFAAWAARTRTLPRFWKLAKASGLAPVITGVAWIARSS